MKQYVYLLFLLFSGLFFCKPASARVIKVGSGSGNIDLTNARAAFSLQDGDTMQIQKGTYTGWGFTNTSGAKGRPIYLLGGPGVIFTGGGDNLTCSSLQYVVIGHLTIIHKPADLFVITGACSDITWNNITMRGIGGFCFKIFDSTIVYNGTPLSYYANFKIMHITADSLANGFIFCSNYNYAAPLKSMAWNWEIAWCNVDSTMNGGEAIRFDACFNLQFHDNRLTNIALSNTTHAATLYLKGDGDVYNNYFYNTFGNDVRAILYGFTDSANKLVSQHKARIYNNISLLKRQFPFTEKEFYPADTLGANGKLRKIPLEVFYNTFGNTSRGLVSNADLVAVFADSVVIQNNALFNINRESPFSTADSNTYYISTDGIDPTSIQVSNNEYAKSYAELGLTDTIHARLDSTSKLIGQGNPVPYITKDMAGQPRQQVMPDIGAIESPVVGVKRSKNGWAVLWWVGAAALVVLLVIILRKRGARR